MDFDQLARVADDRCRLLLLSNPHNPGGIVWDPETLRRLAAFCDERGILVVSDEIHCDMALWDNRHTPFASVSEAAALLAAGTDKTNLIIEKHRLRGPDGRNATVSIARMPR